MNSRQRRKHHRKVWLDVRLAKMRARLLPTPQRGPSLVMNNIDIRLNVTAMTAESFETIQKAMRDMSSAAVRTGEMLKSLHLGSRH